MVSGNELMVGGKEVNKIYITVRYAFIFKGARKASMEGEDRKHVRRQRKRPLQASAAYTPQAKPKQPQHPTESSSAVSGSSTEDNSSQDEYGPPQSSSKYRPETITLTLPSKNILESTALSALRHNISPTVHTAVVADIVKLGGGNLYDTSLSPSTARRQRNRAVDKKHDKIKTGFQANMPTYQELHWDGKVIQYAKGEKDDRICIKVRHVLVYNPFMP